MKLGFATGGLSKGSTEGSARSIPALLDRLLLRKTPSEPICDRDVVAPEEPGSGTFQLINQSQFANALVAIFAGNTPESRRMKSQIEEVGATVMLISQLDLPEAWLQTYASRLTCCVVGHDFSDAAAAADFCLQLRLTSPQLVIVLTSPDVERHDFSPSQRPICDVKLRRPVSRTPLLLGIQAACNSRSVRDLERAADRGISEALWERLEDRSSYKARH